MKKSKEMHPEAAKNPSGLVFIALSAMCFLACAGVPDEVAVVKNFNLQSYMGPWYEIARFDHKFEKNLSNVTATYTITDNGFVQVENSGYNTEKEKWTTTVGKARLRHSATEGALEVSFFGPFYADYNILALDDEYKYALVGGSTDKYLWILSRTPTIPDDIKQHYLNLAKNLGYDTSKLDWIDQSMN
ncbi:MAG: lipocalin family protein [Spirochaetales bacterium]